MFSITNPTALGDQFDAATRDARTHAAQLAAVTGGPITNTVAPAWLCGHLKALREALTADRATFCPHLAAGPGVAYAAVWAPGVLACPTCAPLMLQPSPTEDLRCDACRRTGPDGGQLHPGVVVSGPILLAYGLCSGCRHLADPAAVDSQPPAAARPDRSRRRPGTRPGRRPRR